MLHLFVLVNECWDKIPWCFVKLGEANIDPSSEAKARVVHSAGAICDEFDAGITVVLILQ